MLGWEHSMIAWWHVSTGRGGEGRTVEEEARGGAPTGTGGGTGGEGKKGAGAVG